MIFDEITAERFITLRKAPCNKTDVSPRKNGAQKKRRAFTRLHRQAAGAKAPAAFSRQREYNPSIA